MLQLQRWTHSGAYWIQLTAYEKTEPCCKFSDRLSRLRAPIHNLCDSCIPSVTGRRSVQSKTLRMRVVTARMRACNSVHGSTRV